MCVFLLIKYRFHIVAKRFFMLQMAHFVLLYLFIVDVTQFVKNNVTAYVALKKLAGMFRICRRSEGALINFTSPGQLRGIAVERDTTHW